MYGGQSTHIPLKVNAAGVIPVIFALSLLMFPIYDCAVLARQCLGRMDHQQLCTMTQPLGMVLYVLLIIGFTFFYTFVQINPVQMADQMKKNGGYIPGIRPGKTNVVLLNTRNDANYFIWCDIPGSYLDLAGDSSEHLLVYLAPFRLAVPLC